MYRQKWADLCYRTLKKQLLIISLVLTACSSAPLSTPAPSKNPTPLPTLEPMPEFIAEVWPAPASRTPLVFYQADLIDEIGISGYEGSRPVERAGHRSNICVYLDAGMLVTYPKQETFTYPDDRLYSYEEAVERATLSVDGQKLVHQPDERWHRVGFAGRPGYPYWLCWPAALEVGLHQASFQFRQPDGTVEEFSWLFEITTAAKSE
jgi:hypothetical protein